MYVKLLLEKHTYISVFCEMLMQNSDGSFTLLVGLEQQLFILLFWESNDLENWRTCVSI